MRKSTLSAVSILLAVLALGAGRSATAGVVVYEEGNKKVEVGGRLQLQYVRTDPDVGEARDQVFFRRLRPYITGTVTKNWEGKFQVDFGKSVDSNEVAVKDAYMRYKGWENLTLTIGNSKTPFSREFLASSKRQQTVERGFVGDHNFGTPDRQLGFRLDGQSASKKVTWAAAVGSENHDPDVRRVDFDTPVNRSSDWNEGAVAAARVDFHPRGYMKFDQGDFHTDTFLYTVGVAAFTWSNDDDNNTYTDAVTGSSTSSSKADLDSATGFELSAGVRGRGFSADAEVHLVDADTVDPTFTGGVYRNGTTELDKYQVEAGYMLPNNRVELVVRAESLDADNYQEAWEAKELGVNYFWNQHKVKVQATYRLGENFLGERGSDRDTLFVQFQFVF